MPNWFRKAQEASPAQKGVSLDANQQGTPMPQQSSDDVAQQLSIKLDEAAKLAEELHQLGRSDISPWISQLKEMARNARFLSGF